MVPTPTNSERIDQPAESDHHHQPQINAIEFRHLVENFVDQLSRECGQKLGKPRFVHSVMVLAKSGGFEGEEHKECCQKQLDPSGWGEATLASRNGGNRQMDNIEQADPIEKAVKVLKGTTAMLDETMAKWREEREEGREGKNGRDEEREGKNGRDEGREREMENVRVEERAKQQQNQPTINIRAPQHTPLSAKISFPSELRKYSKVSEHGDGF